MDISFAIRKHKADLHISAARSRGKWQMDCIFPEKLYIFSIECSFFRIALGKEMATFPGSFGNHLTKKAPTRDNCPHFQTANELLRHNVAFNFQIKEYSRYQ